MGKKPATYQDILDAPERFTAEIIGGELYLTPPAAPPHVFTASRAGAHVLVRVDDGDDGPGGWVIVDKPELWLGPSADPRAEVLAPDIAGWHRDRFELPDHKGFTVRPDWVCEVLSPSTARRDRILKLAVYAREGIGHTWLIDPVLETIEVYDNRSGVPALVTTVADVAEAHVPPFEAVTLPVGRWWASSLVSKG